VDRPTPPPFEVEELAAPPGACALRLAGELDLATTGDVGERLEALDGVRAVVLDMADVVFIDSRRSACCCRCATGPTGWCSQARRRRSGGCST